jgi:hypothetical protein
VLTLELKTDTGGDDDAESGGGKTGAAVLSAPPRTRFTQSAETEALARKRKRIAIRHRSGHEVVAVIEIVSPGNKASRHAVRSFVDKSVELLDAGVHLSFVDLFPPGKRDPDGLHAAIWAEFDEVEVVALPADKKLTAVAYSSALLKRAYIEPFAVGDELPDMPLFLEPDRHVLVPLSVTYQSAWEGVPKVWRQRLEAAM